jgi:hypothetical protein
MPDEQDAFFTLTDTTEIVALWWADWPTGDLFAILSRAAVGKPWELLIRLRRRVDDELHPLKSQDRKTGWHIRAQHADPTSDEARDHLEARVEPAMRTILRAVGSPRITRHDVNGGAAQFEGVWRRLSFANTHVIHGGPSAPQ